MANLLKISKIKTVPGFPISASTAYKWATTGKYPGLFVRLGRSVFIDREELDRIVKAQKS